MNKLLSKIIGAALLLSPGIALAAYNDVSLDSNANFSVNSVTVSISGSNNVIQSVTVNNDNTFTLDLVASTTITLTASTLDVTSMSPAFGYVSSCNSGTQTVTFSPPVSSTVIMRPSSTACNTSSSSSSGGGGPPSIIGGGGGGGGSSPVVAPSTQTSKTGLSVASGSTPGASTLGGVSFASDFGVGAEGADVVALQNILSAKGFFVLPAGAVKGTFGKLTKKALQAWQKSAGISPTGYVGPKTRAALNSGSSAPPAATGAASSVLNRDLHVGMIGDDAHALQIFLNTHGFVITASGAGSPGNETSKFGALTKAALAKFQAANGISPASGYFGPKTRAVIHAMK